MIVLTQSDIKSYPRSRALGFKNVEVEAEDGDFVKISIEEGVLKFIKTELSDEDQLTDPITLITKEIGLFGGKNDLINEIEVIFCEDVMIITLIKGSLLFYRGSDPLYVNKDSKAPNITLEDVKWVGAEQLKSLCIMNKASAKEFPYDYEYHIELIGEGTQPNPNDRQHKDNRFLSLKLLSEPNDISGGIIPAIQAQRAVKEQARTIQKAIKPLYTPSKNTNYEFDEPAVVLTESDEDDEYDDDMAYTKSKRSRKAAKTDD